ncbi:MULTISPECIES: F0F1 ATP synthase subunit delta [Staphylococcus]|uniref:ATP synthase subunit delta n=1 Tax=Staphylococcus agnetis TaxID=985762 RepID=A0ABD7TUK4_9STAP|nr:MULTISPECIES: F0F1 ATP synthase subunit delta [Staphylococcus]ALN76989.1 F0F1 ATP synthase subunit delta [Staphylococcus agnetis]KFE40989.1 F0F1 ATP synthase subunit delta [Staphylococcus agnetis]MBY7664982.1 F0F1 ATP synthase subunit delta [Staphylococcus agnetis]MCO4326240.1 F0F1 ATP synthase subunit delta [Staphylococcus agnetis]MCO4338763.1 F0F1 ATP synthase subunit delta [Staphylococcus agnetis]
MAQVAQKYAQALFDVAIKAEVLSEIYKDFTEINTSIQSEGSRLHFIDLEPKFTLDERQTLVSNVFNGVHPYLMNTLKVMASHRNLSLLGDVFKAFENHYNEFHGLDDAYLVSARPLSDAEVEHIKEALVKRTGLKDLKVHTSVDTSLIGGVKVKIGTKVYDGSVQNDLEQLARRFSSAH